MCGTQIREWAEGVWAVGLQRLRSERVEEESEMERRHRDWSTDPED